MAARRLRPIRRWISAVRPGLPCETSPLVRVWVARGSMAYSAVSQPRRCRFWKGGTVLDARGHQHAGVAERDQRRAFGEFEDAGLDAHRAQGVQGAAFGREGRRIKSLGAAKFTQSPFRRDAENRRAETRALPGIKLPCITCVHKFWIQLILRPASE